MERAELREIVRATGCAEERDGFVFLRDPNWSAAECAQVAELQSKIENRESKIPEGWLCVPTGGTSGGVRFARHDERTLGAAVRGFCAHFGMERVNAVDVLPPFHVSGLMARARCAATGGEHVAWEWKRMAEGDVPGLREGADYVLSLVPTQLQRLLASAGAVAWLRKFRVIFIGGGPAWAELANEAARAGLRLSLSYGMTETAAMVAALRPEEFLDGVRSSGTALPHAQISIGDDGAIRVAGESVFHGYFPQTTEERVFATEDLGRIDERGHLHVLGRRDAVIITGGKKVQPAEVEATLRATGQFADVAVVGVPDATWGEMVVACYPVTATAPDFVAVERAITGGLAAFKRPKRYVPVAEWPRNAQGKVNRAELRRLALPA